MSRFLTLAVVLLGAADASAGSAVALHGSVGFVAGQSIRVSVSNPSVQGSPAPQPVLMTVRVLDSSGNALAVSPLLTVGAGQTKTYVVKRSNLSAPGEPGTGRLQIRPETYLQIPSQPSGTSQSVSTVAELVEESTGKESGMIGDIRTVISAEAAVGDIPEGADR